MERITYIDCREPPDTAEMAKTKAEYYARLVELSDISACINAEYRVKTINRITFLAFKIGLGKNEVERSITLAAKTAKRAYDRAVKTGDWNGGLKNVWHELDGSRLEEVGKVWT